MKRVFKRVLRFLKQYRLFSLAVTAIITGLLLELTKHHTLSHWVLAIVSLIALLPLIFNMWQDVRSGRYGIDILAATAILTAVILGEYWAAIVVVLMLTGGEALEDFAEHRARSELDALLSHAPQKANLIRKGKLVEVRVSELKVGDKLLIKAGEVVPVDSLVLEGTASFDESSLTGESLPETKSLGSQLLSGSVNLDGAVTAKATADAAGSQYQQIIKLVRAASANQAPFVRLADRYSLPFTVLAYAIATAVWVISGDATRFLEVIVVATPCPLLLAAPIAIISGMARASKFGIIVKTGSALERLAEAQTIAFDKTGTLTRSALTVDDIIPFNGHDKSDVLGLAASLEQNSNHVVANAIVESAKSKGIKFSKAKHVKEISGRGLKAHLKGQDLVVGSLSLLTAEGIEPPARFKVSSISKTSAYVAADGQLIGIITLSDEPRPESHSTIQKLKQLGAKHIMMVTGDNRQTARAIADQLEIDDIYSEMLPADKLHAVEQAKHRPLAFVGDGVNDAPVLTAADVGIALGARGSTAASESADMVILLDDISRVAAAYEISKGTFRIARQSILIGIALSIGLMIAFATGRFTALQGALVQEIVDVFVIFNALRAHFMPVSMINQTDRHQ